MLRQGGGAQADQVRPGGHVPAARHNTRVGSFLLIFLFAEVRIIHRHFTIISKKYFN